VKVAPDSADAEQERAVTNGKMPPSARLIASRDSNGRLTGGPGTLLAKDVGVVSPDAEGKLLAEYALAHGLRPSAQRPSIPAYIVQLWRRAHFIMAFATARNIAMYTEARLGQLWQVLTPLLNAGVYFLIFGELLHINRGIPNYLGFVVTGVFIFNFTQRAFISTSTVITTSLPLIRALQFPRAALPLAYVMIELQQMLVSMVVLVPILLLTGEPLTWQWLLVFPVLLLQTMFNVGAGLAVARLGSQVNDFAQLLPFLMRTWLYMSGVIFSIASLTGIKDKIVALLQINPAALYITLSRNALMATQRQSAFGSKPYSAANCGLWHTLGHEATMKVLVHGKTVVEPVPKKYEFYSAYCHYVGANPSHFWLYAIGWAVVALAVGFYFFWRAETRYGRG
jgi:teichoic acid transport system permease protein